MPTAHLRQQDRPRRGARARPAGGSAAQAEARDRGDGDRSRISGRGPQAIVPLGPGDTAFRRRLGELLAEDDELDPGGVRRGRRRSRTDVLRTALAEQTGRARACIRSFSARRSTGAGIELLMSGVAELLPATAGDVDGACSRGRCSRSSATRPGRRSCTSGCSRERSVLPRSGHARAWRRGEGDEDQCLRRAVPTRLATRSRQARSRRSGGLGGIEIGGAIGRQAVVRGAPVRRRRRWRRWCAPDDRADARGAAPRPLPARRAGSADRRCGRTTSERAPCLALRRGAEGGHQGDARERLRPRRHVRETTTICIERPLGIGEARRDGSMRNRTRSWPRSGSASSRRATRRWSSYCWRSTHGRSRSTSTRRSRASGSTSVGTFARRCAKASSAGRSRAARSR